MARGWMREGIIKEFFSLIFFPLRGSRSIPFLSPLNTLCPKSFHLEVICLELKVPFLKQAILKMVVRCL